MSDPAPPPSDRHLRFDAAGVAAYLDEVWPESTVRMNGDTIERLDPGRARMRVPVEAAMLRPGATVSGPTLMGLADNVAYVLMLGHLGDAALAVTTHLSIDFVRRPSGVELVADARLVKLGRSLGVMTVDLHAVAEAGAEPDPDRPVAVVSVTYSLSLV